MSYVAIGQYQCPVCLELHSHDAPVLLHKRLKDIPEDKTVLGWKLRETHAQQKEEGYVFLIEVKNPEGTALTFSEATRTGKYLAIKLTAIRHFLAKGHPLTDEIAFITPEVFTFFTKQFESIT